MDSYSLEILIQSGIENYNLLSECKIQGVNGVSPSYWLNNIGSLPTDDVKGVCVLLGVNNPSEIASMKQLIDALQERYSSVPIFVQRVFPVGEGYANASSLNNSITAFNAAIEEYCNGKEKVIYIDTTKGFVGSDGYLLKGATDDNLHLKSSSYSAWIDNIRNKILGSTMGAAEAIKFEDQDVITPGIGEITKISDKSITIKFTEINVVKNMEMTISGFQVDENLKKGDVLDKEQKIGKTLKEDILLILRSPTKAVIENVEDYMPPPEIEDSSNPYFGDLTEDEFEFFATVLIAENGKNADTMTAVAHVIKNRAQDTVHFGDVTTIPQVLTAGGQYGSVYKVPGSGPGPVPGMGNEGNPPSGTRTYKLEGLGEYWVGNAWKPVEATEESRQVAREVLDGTREDKASQWLGKLALFQVTLADYQVGVNRGLIEQHKLYAEGELYGHDWGSINGNPENDSCTYP